MQFVRSRDARRRRPRWRKSSGPKRSLGWIPFNAAARVIKFAGAGFLHHATHAVACRYERIIVGNVNASRLARLAKSGLDAGWSMFGGFLPLGPLIAPHQNTTR